MLNYIKSELYRAMRSREIHGAAIGLLGMILFMNVVLYLMSGLEHFRYGITSFSYSMLVSFPMFYCYAASAVAVFLYEPDKRNGTLGNSVSYSISRPKLFAGKCLVTLATSLVLLALTLPVYIGSASLLLEHTGPTTVQEMLTEVPAASLIAVASLVFAVLLLEICDKILIAILIWLTVMFFLPEALMLAGMALASKTEFLLRLALWMPANFFTAGVQVNMSECVVLWETAEGMTTCLLSGAAGILVFGITGALLLRKKEL